MANVAKHSAATCCNVKLQCDESLFKMIIQDNGKGFELTEVLSRETSRRGLGLTGMRERVEMMGGEFHIVSNPGKGTIMKAQIPLSICSESR
jgi:signal transduction histidine kinase